MVHHLRCFIIISVIGFWNIWNYKNGYGSTIFLRQYGLFKATVKFL